MSDSPLPFELADSKTSGLPLTADATVNWPERLAMLSRPFPASSLQWRAGAVSRDRKRAQALPFVDPRLYEDRLNAVCPGEWHVHFLPWGDSRLICELTISGVTRASTGEFDDSDRISQGPSAEAQAFKRACSKFGLGRYLYEIPIEWVDYDEEKRRLVNTPELADRFLPGRQVVRDLVGAAEAAETAAVGESDETLTSERAEAMARELEKLGVGRDEQRRFAAAVLGRKIGALTQLTDDEALEVWNVAKRNRQELAV